MKRFLVIASVIAICNCQGGYNYNAPSSSGISGFGNAQGTGGGSYASTYTQGSSGGIGHSGVGGAGGFGSLGGLGGLGGLTNSFSSSGSNGFNMNQQSLGNIGGGFSGQNSFSGNGLNSFSNMNGLDTSYANYASQAPIIHKHVYVHVPPTEPEEKVFRAPLVAPPPTKNYKIIFVKAPSPPAYVNPIIPAQQQNEEKTLVYVLVKKPEEQPDIVIPTAAPTTPSKPEVYFIKYKSLKESAGGIGGGVSGIGGGSGGVSGIGGINGGVSGIGGIAGGISGGGSGLGIATGPGTGFGGIDESVVVDNPFAKSSQDGPAPVYGPPSSQNTGKH